MINKYRFVILAGFLLFLIGAIYASGLWEGKQSELKNTPVPTAEPTVKLTGTPQPLATAIISNPSDLFTYTDCGEDIIVKQTSTNSVEGRFSPTPLTPGYKELSGIRAISTSKFRDDAGYGYKFGTSYALHEDGSLYAWGLRNFEHSYASDSFPRLVDGLPAIVQTEGEFALSAAGDVWYLNKGEVPFKLQALNDVQAMRQDGRESLIVLKKDQTIGILINRRENPQWKFVRIAMKDVKQVYAGLNTFYVIQKDGTLWEAVSSLNTSDMNEVNVNIFKQIQLPQSEKTVQVDATILYNKVFIKTDDDQWYEYNPESKLIQKVLLQDTVKVVGNEFSIVALKKDGTVWSWNGESELKHSEGYNGTLNKAVQAEDIKDAVDIQSGSDHVLVLTRSGKVFSWGSNMYGQLGRSPFYFDKLTTVGTMKDIEGVYAGWQVLYLFQKDAVWRLDETQQMVPVLQGRSVIKMSGAEVFFTKTGEIIVLGPGDDQCHLLKATMPILDVEGSYNTLLVRLQNNDIFEVEVDSRQINQIHKIAFNPALTGNITQMMKNVLWFVITDNGQMYVQDWARGEERMMKPVSDLPVIKEASPIYGSFYDESGIIAKVLDPNGNAYNIELTVKRNEKAENVSKAFKTIKTSEKAEHLLGAMTISQDGHLKEQEHFKVEDRLPAGDRPRLMASSYSFSSGGEGQSTFYHVFVLQDGRIQWLGYSPFYKNFSRPGSVMITSDK